ncbi:MAG: M28 family metallopeptidase [Gemmatimonadota bacterium]|nr:M28 family metallopeptidase [Gemmatimonadota bacterium]
MHQKSLLLGIGLVCVLSTNARAQRGRSGAPADTTEDPVKTMVGRLELERYKATVKGLTQFGDRRQGTKRNRDAVDWIEAQLKSYGCTNTERITYNYAPAPAPPAFRAAGATGADGPPPGTPPQVRPPTGSVIPEGRSVAASGGGRTRGIRTTTGVNSDSLKQTDLTLRALNAEPTTPGARQMVYCTKIGTTHPDEMYIVGAHMDGHGWGEAANDDGSGTAIVMELARIFSNPEVTTERSIRFALWNNEETGLNAAKAYVEQRSALQGIENPKGSGKYPEPKWLGMIQHDMMMFDHGMPRADGTIPPEQRPEADVNIEFQSNSKMADASQKLAWLVAGANEKYATDYPAAVGNHMTNTDSDPFKDIVAAISLRENERGREIGAGWDPHWHQVTDIYKTFSDKDFRLGLNAAQSTLGAVGTLTGAKLKKLQ